MGSDDHSRKPDDLLLPFINRPKEVHELLFGDHVPSSVMVVAARLQRLFPGEAVSSQGGDKREERRAAAGGVDGMAHGQALSNVLFVRREHLGDAQWLVALRSLVAGKSEETWARLAEVLGANLLRPSEWQEFAKTPLYGHGYSHSPAQGHARKHKGRSRNSSFNFELLPDVPEEWTAPLHKVDQLHRLAGETVPAASIKAAEVAGVRISTAEDEKQQQPKRGKESRQVDEAKHEPSYFNDPATNAPSLYDFHFCNRIQCKDSAAMPLAREGLPSTVALAAESAVGKPAATPAATEKASSPPITTSSEGGEEVVSNHRWRRPSFVLSFQNLPSSSGAGPMQARRASSPTTSGQSSSTNSSSSSVASGNDTPSSPASSTSSLLKGVAHQDELGKGSARRRKGRRSSCRNHRLCHSSEAAEEGKCGMHLQSIGGANSVGNSLAVYFDSSDGADDQLPHASRSSRKPSSDSDKRSRRGSSASSRNEQGNVVEGLLPDGRTRHPSAGSPAGSEGAIGPIEAFRRKHRLSDACLRGEGVEDGLHANAWAEKKHGAWQESVSRAVSTSMVSPRDDHDYSNNLAFGGQVSKEKHDRGGSGLALGGGFSLQKNKLVTAVQPEHRHSPPEPTLRVTVASTPSSTSQLLSSTYLSEQGGRAARPPHDYRRPGGFIAFSRECHAARQRQRALSSASELSEALSTGSQAVASSEGSTLADEDVWSPPHPYCELLGLYHSSDAAGWPSSHDELDSDNEKTPSLNASNVHGFEWANAVVPPKEVHRRAPSPASRRHLSPLPETEVLGASRDLNTRAGSASSSFEDISSDDGDDDAFE
ncbi:hypothetical protein K437DRAFT_108641 [Tilletiaria anomala UBC 951]|uniref:Uncharacterized protein n=1 Tax=Tilletiaria anomala (strain ATCC 24038 / CBS 436.72 / UBC 951) TaxID=1037660 RepID=A0A066W156_TILAU|nr:uncharacterized protein K437DRAFT_108641 [Tilletiaria anomala UBC 951]KDN46273.1 hypothetical protein K437DRAFT_108641 [Tilletiaria anomala UBC 951]